MKNGQIIIRCEKGMLFNFNAAKRRNGVSKMPGNPNK